MMTRSNLLAWFSGSKSVSHEIKRSSQQGKNCLAFLARCQLLKTFLLIASVVLIGACSDSGDEGGIFPPNDDTSVWTLNDQCQDGDSIQARFFEAVDNGQGIGQVTGRVWPGGNEVYVSSSDGVISQALSCTSQTLICYGATPRNNSIDYWGAGIDGTRTCIDCCFSCGFSPTVNLTC